MTTKKKCLELAAQHGITIDYNSSRGSYFFHISLPAGLGFMGQTGLTMYLSDGKSAAELWRECWTDLQVCLEYQPWERLED